MSTNGTLSLALPSGRNRGYVEVGAGSLINGAIGVMVAYGHMPTGMLLTLRMAVAAVILAVPFVLFRHWHEVWQPGVPLRLLSLGLVVAVNLILYFVSIRYAGVAVAIFLSYMAPLYLAVLAPLFLKERTERVVWIALGISVVGMLAIVLPGAFAGGANFSVLGVTAGIGAGFGYTGCLLLRKKLRPRVTSAIKRGLGQSAARSRQTSGPSVGVKSKISVWPSGQTTLTMCGRAVVQAIWHKPPPRPAMKQLVSYWLQPSAPRGPLV